MLPQELQTLLPLLQEQIEKASTIALFGHENIDQDSLGAMLGLGLLLEKLGKTVSYYTTIQPSHNHSFDTGFEKVKIDFDYGEYDLLCFIDFCEYNRIQGFTLGHEEYFDSKPKIVIDHHIMQSRYPNALLLRDETSSSSCGLCYEIMSQIRPDEIDSTIATLWYTGLMTDTGNFMRSKKVQRDFGIAQELLVKGADKEFIIKHLYYTASTALIPMATKILSRSTIIGDIVYTWYTQQELDEIGLSDDDVEPVHLLLRSIQDIPVSLRLRLMPDKRSGSLRSGWDKNGKRYNVADIARSFGKGGGHILAAGFSTAIDTSLSTEDDVKRIVALVQKQIDLQKGKL